MCIVAVSVSVCAPLNISPIVYRRNITHNGCFRQHGIQVCRKMKPGACFLCLVSLGSFPRTLASPQPQGGQARRIFCQMNKVIIKEDKIPIS